MPLYWLRGFYIITTCLTLYRICFFSPRCFASLPFNFHTCYVCPDVYSYDEDDMVLDSKLPEHLAHFGINMMTMEKVSSVFSWIRLKKKVFMLNLYKYEIKCFAMFNIENKFKVTSQFTWYKVSEGYWIFCTCWQTSRSLRVYLVGLVHRFAMRSKFICTANYSNAKKTNTIDSTIPYRK